MLWERFVQENDQSAFEILVHRHGSMVLACAQRVLTDRTEAEDVFQATFLSLARAKQKLRQPEALTSWLYQTAFRIAIKLRSKRFSTNQTATENVEPANQESDLAWREVSGVLDEELQRLPNELRSPLLLCYLNGLSRDEAAKQLGCSFDQLKRRLEKGRDALRVRLEKRGIVGAAMAITILSPELLNATVPTQCIEKIMVWLRAEGVIPETIASLAATTQTLSKGVVMKSFVAAAICVGAGMWGYTKLAGIEPQQKPEQIQEIKAEAEPPSTTGQPENDSDRKAGSQQSRVSINNLKELMLAVHNYHDTHAYFPVDVTNKDGKALLSWRVLLLPYLGKTELFKQFKLDEPWDSPANIKLLPQMPDIYRVGIEPKNSITTYYQVFSGKSVPMTTVLEDDVPENAHEGRGPGGGAGAASGTPIPKKADNDFPKPPAPAKKGIKRYVGTRMNYVTDGLSNTFGIVEAGPPAPWTRPGGIPFDEKKPLPAMPGPFKNTLHVSMMDGTAHAIKRDLPENTMKILIGANDGNIAPEVIKLRQSFPPDSPEETAELKKRVEENRVRYKQLLNLYQKQLDLFEEFNKNAEGFVETELIKDGLQAEQERLMKEINLLQQELAKRKVGADGKNRIPIEPTPAKK